jgi:hypothetical protein
MDKKKKNIKINTITYWISTVLYSLFRIYSAFYFISSNSQDYLIFLGLPNWFSFELGFGMFLGGLILIFPFFPARLKEWAYVAPRARRAFAYAATVRTLAGISVALRLGRERDCQSQCTNERIQRSVELHLNVS